MSNQLNMADHQAILGLARLNWSQRRIAAELGIDRQTVSRHLKTSAIDPSGTVSAANAAMVITGSAGPVADSNATIVITGSAGLATDGSSGVAAPLADSNATNVITGSAGLTTGGSGSLAAGAAPGRGSQCEPWRAVILETRRGTPVLPGKREEGHPYFLKGEGRTPASRRSVDRRERVLRGSRFAINMDAQDLQDYSIRHLRV